LDKWALSKLNSLIKTIENHLDAYKITEAARALAGYVDDLSNWYIRRSRERFWAKEMPRDKVNAYMTLNTILEALIKISAPFVPFMTEMIYLNIVKSVDVTAPDSVHLTDYPKCDERAINLELEKNMDAVLKIVSLGRAARNYAQVKNRQPLANMYVKYETVIADDFIDIVKEELNVKNVEYRDDAEKFISYRFKPQLKTLGPKYGKLLPKISVWLNGQNGNSLMELLNNTGKIAFTLDGADIELAKEDLIIEPGQAEGFAANEDREAIVVLGLTLTDELIEEGFVREIVSKIQTMRKEAGFEVMDRIEIGFAGTDRIAEIINANADKLKEETLCESIVKDDIGGYKKEWDINGEKVEFRVLKR
jgi:isoleucyl-tRNA synthetase